MYCLAPAQGLSAQGVAPSQVACQGRTAGQLRAVPMDLDHLTDEELITRIREDPEANSATGLYDVLYERYYQKVAYWCFRVCGNSERATDLAQEVFLRVHTRLGSFRLESRFSTWLYSVTRSVAINRSKSERLRRMASLDAETAPDPVDPSPGASELAERNEIAAEFRRAMETDLEPLEAKVLYLHFVDGMTLKGITDLLGLENKSGAKAYIVSGKRRLQRRFGRWLARQGEA